MTLWLGLVVLLAVWALTRWLGAGTRVETPEREAPWIERYGVGQPAGPAHDTVVQSLSAVSSLLRSTPRREHLRVLREYLDAMGEGHVLDAQFLPVDAGGVRAEWVLAPGSDPARRTLYIHGGAFMMGSPRSHRVLTERFSHLSGGAVLAIDYRLMPEHTRLAGIEDCRKAWQWMCDNGPAGAAPARTLFVAGDSAGGNLTLSLLEWARTAGVRQPHAAVALSPLTDATLGSASLRSHVKTDPMLGPLFGPLARVPRAALLWIGWAQNRVRPADTRLSPVLGDLSGLPPVLIQASTAEMLSDDARRYAARARAQGSPVRLQMWEHMVHVWQIFHPQLPQASEAWGRIGEFLEEAAPV